MNQEITHPSVDIIILVSPTTELPAYGTSLSSGFDIKADIREPITIKPGQRVLISSGLKLKIPVGYELQIRPRSGLALNHGITVVNSPGTIDADYRNFVGIILINHGLEDFIVRHGMKIAQGVVTQVFNAKFCIVENLDETNRKGGFGSTGI